MGDGCRSISRRLCKGLQGSSGLEGSEVKKVYRMEHFNGPFVKADFPKIFWKCYAEFQQISSKFVRFWIRESWKYSQKYLCFKTLSHLVWKIVNILQKLTPLVNFEKKSFWIFKNTAKVFSNERIQGRCKDDNVDFENVEKLCSDWKIGVDTAENEPRKDPEKWTIQRFPLVLCSCHANMCNNSRI